MTALQKEMISTRLRAIRNLRGKTQDEFGAITGLNAYYGNIERGQDNPSDSTILRIAEKLNVDFDWLLNGDGESPLPKRISTPEVKEVVPVVEEKKLAPATVIYPEQMENEKPDFNREEEPARPSVVTVKSEMVIIEVEHETGLCLKLTKGSTWKSFDLEFNRGTRDISYAMIAAYVDLFEWVKSYIQEAV